jgi:DUF1680 family protein
MTIRVSYIALYFALSLSVPATGQVIHPGISPHAKFVQVGIGDAKWTDGFWAQRFDLCRTSIVPEMRRLMEGVERSHFLHNFKIAAGIEKGLHRGPAWNDGDFYKWLEAAAAVFASTKDEKLNRQMDAAIAVIAKAQRADGYLHTPVLIKNRNGDSNAKPFADRLNFEMYNFGHLFTAACVHHQATGNQSLLDVARKAADFLCAAFQDPTPELARNSVCPSHFMGILDLYRATGEKKYLRLAVKWLDMRDLVRDGTDDNQDRLPFRKQTEAVGHAVRANYLYAGVADLFAETGDKSLLEPLEKIWTSAVRRKMYVTGACGALYDGAAPDGSKDQKSIARIHQAYGRDYQLPNSTAHNETCASIGSVLWNWRMLMIHSDARYADTLELALYNAVLAGVSLDGTKFFYTNTLRQLDAMPAILRWSRQREAWISSYCCPPNVARLLAQVHRYAYGRSDDAIWVHLFGGSTLDTTLPNGGRVQLTQTTDYPWNGKVTIRLDSVPEREFTLHVRIPGWADGATLSLNGRALADEAASGAYAAIRRKWAIGDEFAILLPMRVRVLQSHPLVEETRNQVAVQRGPIVYCLESTDLEKGIGLQRVRIPSGIELKPRFEPKLLAGIAVLEGKAHMESEAVWDKELYRELRTNATQPIALRLIPYYAWCNRGPSEMSVWMPLSR